MVTAYLMGGKSHMASIPTTPAMRMQTPMVTG